MYSTFAVLCVLAVGFAFAEDRTLGSLGTSALTQIIGQSHQAPYPPAPPPAAPHTSYGWPQENPGFTVQSGYEGLIIPTGPAHEPHSPLKTLGGIALGASLLTHLLPFPFNKIALAFGTKLGLWILGFLLLVLIGGATTTAVCAFTPICTISFLGFGFNRENTRALLSQDRINTVTQFVYDAIDKYRKIQKRASKSINKSKNNKNKKTNSEAKEESREDNATELNEESNEVRNAEEFSEVKEIQETNNSSRQGRMEKL